MCATAKEDKESKVAASTTAASCTVQINARKKRCDEVIKTLNMAKSRAACRSAGRNEGKSEENSAWQLLKSTVKV